LATNHAAVPQKIVEPPRKGIQTKLEYGAYTNLCNLRLRLEVLLEVFSFIASMLAPGTFVTN